jgi:hypothetical protein
MAGGKGNIKPGDNPKPFQKGQVNNPWGRPKKLVSQIIADAKEDGMEAVTASQVSDVISVLLNYSVESVKLIAADKSLPILIQRTARRFAGASDKDWDGVLRDNLDRAHGKAKQSVEHSGKEGAPIQFENVPLENRIAALALLEPKNDGE